MRVILFFDLPNVYAKDKRNYFKFRKYLLSEGFLMMQESVYSKIALNRQQADFLINRVRKNVPKQGLIQVLIVTEKQYAEIQFLIGESNTKIVNNEDRLTVL